MTIAQNLASVRERMAKAAGNAGRDPNGITLVAVSKIKPASAIKEAMAAGQFDFGENYAQEMRDKMAELGPGPRWHFIGRLQKNKVKYVAGKAWLLHTLDSLDLARELEKRLAADGKTMLCLIEVNVGGEKQKTGVEPEKVYELALAVRDMKCLHLGGLMTMPPFFDDPEKTRPFYKALREIRDGLRCKLDDPDAMPDLSMGLSNDFEIAIAEGATLVRVGTAIFGERAHD